MRRKVARSETEAGAIHPKVAERLRREGRWRPAQVRTRRMRAIAERCAALVGPGLSSTAHGALLYDERGLAK